MTSKEALEEVRNVLSSNPGTEKYSDIFQEHLLKPIEKDLEELTEYKNLEEKLGFSLIDLFTKGIWFSDYDDKKINHPFPMTGELLIKNIKKKQGKT